MSTLDEVGRWIHDELPRLLETYGAPAAAVAVLAGGEVVEQAAGVLHRGTGVEATTDSVFQIGSITKLWTSTLVMQLVDEGLVDLDRPVRTWLPEFRTADEQASAAVTPRMLLTHTAGFEGDIFTDTGPGDDAVEKYLEVLHDVPQLFPPGEMYSYNNAGFCVLGRLVEVLRGSTFDTCVRERIADPLGLTHVAPSPYEAVMHRAAMGHVEREPGGGWEPAPAWALVRSNAPAGSMLATSAADLVAFARMHLEDGRAPDGTQVLAPGTAARMRERLVEMPHPMIMGDARGLGFARTDTPAGAVVGHDGATIGQESLLRMVPDAGVAVAVLTNGGHGQALQHEIAAHVLAELAGITLPPLVTPPAEPSAVDAERLLGTYSARAADCVVSLDDDGTLWLEDRPSAYFRELGDHATRWRLVHLEGDTFVTVESEGGVHLRLTFLGDDGHGRPLYLFTGRAIRRAGA
jgi:CubicO group peptidase (beta-lactamase class C family)